MTKSERIAKAKESLAQVNAANRASVTDNFDEAFIRFVEEEREMICNMFLAAPVYDHSDPSGIVAQ